MLGDPIIQTKQRSTNIFELVDGHPTPATNIAKLEHRVREPARKVNMITALSNQSLLIRGRFAEAGYVSVCHGDEVNIYDGQTATITVSEDAVLKGWRCYCGYPSKHRSQTSTCTLSSSMATWDANI